MITSPQARVRPPEVNRAIGLEWLSLAISAAAAVIDWRRFEAMSGGALFAGMDEIPPFAVMAFLIWKTAQGRNWARITQLVLFVGGLLLAPVVLPAYFKFYHSSPSAALVLVVQTVIPAYALCLLFTAPGRAWFE